MCACDYRIGVTGPFKIGLNEVAIGMPLPIFAMELARARLSKRHLTQAVAQARIYDPAGAVDAGYLDEVVEPDAFEQTAMERAAAMAGLPDPAHRLTKRSLNAAVARHIESTLAEDMDRIG